LYHLSVCVGPAMRGYAALASVAMAEPEGTPVVSDINTFHMQSGLPGTGDSQAGHSWYQRAVDLLEYEPEDGDGVFDTSFGTGGAWLKRAGVTDPVGVCPCPSTFQHCCDKNPGHGEKCGWLFESFEGGTQYLNGLVARVPKWRVGDSTGCYLAYTQSNMFHSGEWAPHSCSWADSDKKNPNHKRTMGLAQVSNRLMLLPDGQTFEKQGMIGVSYVRTPFGKTSASDNRNFWTIVMDTENYAGPTAYFLPEFWNLRDPKTNGTTDSYQDFSTVPLIGMSGPAWEAINMKQAVDGDVTKILKMSMPQTNGRTVLWMGQRSHNDTDIQDPLEEALASGTLDTSKIMANGKAPTNCEKAERDISFGNAGTWGTAKNTLESGDCVWAVKVANESCPLNGKCMLPRYYENKKPVDASTASSALQKQRFPMKGPTTNAYDALTNAPAGGCRDSPGPSDQALYCANTLDNTWVGYRWYKFVEQPAMQQLHLTSEEKDFMQERVTTLHKMVPTPVSKWINGRQAEVEGMAKTDAAAIATPPKGLEYGYVPIVLYQGYTKPSECVDVVQEV